MATSFICSPVIVSEIANENGLDLNVAWRSAGPVERDDRMGAKGPRRPNPDRERASTPTTNAKPMRLPITMFSTRAGRDNKVEFISDFAASEAAHLAGLTAIGSQARCERSRQARRSAASAPRQGRERWRSWLGI